MHVERVEGHGRLRGRLEDPALTALLLAAFDTTEQGFLVYDRAGRVVEANPAAGRMLGMTMAELVATTSGDPVWDRLREIDGAPITRDQRPSVQALATGRPVRGRLVVVAHEGTDDVVLRVDAHPIGTGNEQVVVTGLVDVSAEFSAQQALTAAHARARQTLADVRRLAAEQAAVGRIATAIAQQPDDAAILALIATEVAGLFDAEDAVIVELPAGGAPVVRAHARGHETTSLAGDPGITAPVQIGGLTWGHVALSGARGEDIEPRLARMAELIATAVIAAAARTQLVVQATEDPVTGLLNHRAFHDRLSVEVHRAQRHDRPLSLVLVDLDAFKAINDTYGHQVGDRVLQRVGEVLRGLGRDGDVLGRLGGDEFALLFPETDPEGACLAAERALQLLNERPVERGILVTASAGVAGLADEEDADRLLRNADAALYRAKAEGRDGVAQYTPASEARGAGRAQDVARSRALTALRALAHVIDGRDPAMHGHSERVASMAAALAAAGDWPAEEISALREAALVHDIGKLAVPMAVLHAPGPLDDAGRAQVARHAELGADIARVALAPRQVEWIRHHHERPDGTGYPDGLTAEAIPAGAGLLALAESWDVMVHGGRGQEGRAAEVADTECAALEGRQFTTEAIQALRRLRADGVS